MIEKKEMKCYRFCFHTQKKTENRKMFPVLSTMCFSNLSIYRKQDMTIFTNEKHVFFFLLLGQDVTTTTDDSMNKPSLCVCVCFTSNMI